MPNILYYVFGINAIFIVVAMLIEQKDIDEAREMLGDTAKDITDDELKDILVEIQYLVECWMEEYERTIFNGKTLNELLGTS